MSVRTQTSAPSPKYSMTDASVVSNGGYTVIYLSRDRTRFYATTVVSSRTRRLHYSTDGGSTWTQIKDVSSLSANFDIVGMVELPDGEILLALSAFGSFAAKIYKTTGFVADPASAVYTLTNDTLWNTQLTSEYTLNDECIGSNGVILAGESGSQTDGFSAAGLTKVNGGSGYTTANVSAVSGGSGESFAVSIIGGAVERIAVLNGGTGHTDGVHSFSITGDGTGADWTYTVAGGVIDGVQTAKARRLFLSEDFGDTWEQIFDIYTTPDYKYGIGIHLHAAAYDEEWDRIWLLTGDNTGDGASISGYPTNTQVVYSDDRGATWNWLAADQYLEGMGIEAQYTSINVYKHAIVLGTDALKTPIAFTVIPKIGYRTMGESRFGGGLYLQGTGVVRLGRKAFSASNQYPTFFTYSIGASTNDPVVLLSHDGGFTWTELWRETDFATRPLLSGACIRGLFGPDVNNKLLGNYFNYSSFLKGTLVQNY